MIMKKEILVNEKKAVLSYDDSMFGKDANTLKYESCMDAEILFVDSNIRAVLLINGEEYYCDSKADYVDDFYFEVVDRDKFDNELGCSDVIYEEISNEEELIEVIVENSSFVNNMDMFKICPKGFVSGFCDKEASDNCEYSALKIEGLCGAECQDCMDEIHASKEDEAYVCDCTKILFKERHKNI